MHKLLVNWFLEKLLRSMEPKHTSDYKQNVDSIGMQTYGNTYLRMILAVFFKIMQVHQKSHQ